MADNYLTGVSGPTSVSGGLTADQIVQQMARTGLTQEGVNAVYEMRGLGPAPTVPPSLIGRPIVSTRGGTRFSDGSAPSGSDRDFLNAFNTVAVDPYRVPSGISDFAGGALGLIGSAVGGPVWTAMTTAADYGNQALGNESSSSDLGQYGAIGTAIGSAYNAAGGPGSYSANANTGVPGGTIDESGAMGGASGSGGSPNVLGSGGGMASNWGDWINLAGQLAGAYFQGQGARDEADASAAGSAAGIAEQRRQFDLSRADQMPWLQSGVAALGRLNDPNAFTQSPGYEFVRGEGNRDINNSFAARGGALSGNALRRLNEYNTGLASQEYNNWFNRESNLAGLGQVSAQSLGSLGQNNANNVSNLLSQQGNARASGIAGQTNALTGGISDFLSWYNRRGN